MEIVCDLLELGENDLTPNEFCYLYCLWKSPDSLPEYPVDLGRLQANGWIKDWYEGLVLREKFFTLVGIKADNKLVLSWIEEWRALWPASVKSAGRLVRGDKHGCIKKMKTLLRENPSFTKEEIFAVTEHYIMDRANHGYNFMTCADYFISKNRSSQLAALIEDYRERGNIYDEGSSSFAKEI